MAKGWMWRYFAKQGGRNQGDKPGAGPGGFCICPECDHQMEHEADVPCNEIECPECGHLMTRE